MIEVAFSAITRPLNQSDGIILVDAGAELTPEWLSSVLQKSGLLPSGRVSETSQEPVGNGMTGTTVRIYLTYEGDRGSNAPETLIAKMTSIHDASRATGAALGIYRKEVRFYQNIAPAVPTAVPQAIFADVDDKGERFLLLMEDLHPARSGDQIAGCSVKDAASALHAIAAVHAPYWGRAHGDQVPWIDRDHDTSLFASGYQGAVASVMKRYEHAISHDLRTIALQFGEQVHAYYDQQPKPWTITHQDFRLDNMLFDAKGGKMPVAIVDWQTVRVGPGLSDVAYFIGAGLMTDERRMHEESLVEHYRQQLQQLGVTDVSRDEAWRQYRLFAAEGLITAVVAASMLTPTERGDRMFVAMIERHAQHMRDLDTLSLIRAVT